MPKPTDPGERDSYGILAEKSIEVLMAYLDGGDDTPQALARAKIASSTLASATRHNQALGAARALDFMMAREIASNPDELKRYIQVTMPSSALVKALPIPAN